MNEDAKILITTPDYPPKLGGLSTFTIQIEKVLSQMNLKWDRMVWNGMRDLRGKSKKLEDKYQVYIHIHFMGMNFFDCEKNDHIVFYHGSEILFTSPSFIKKAIKKTLKSVFVSRLERPKYNVFISQFTMKALEAQGFNPNYGRDIVFHNCISIDDANYEKRSLDSDELSFVCVARDVPHKNIDGCIELVKTFSKISGKKSKLFITANRSYKDNNMEVVSLPGMGEEKKIELYKTCHFNLLLSLDHRHRGFYEGFGLVALEAAKFGTPTIAFPTGGLPENIHDRHNGWLINSLKVSDISILWDDIQKSYSDVSYQCFEHVMSSHGLNQYRKLLGAIL